MAIDTKKTSDNNEAFESEGEVDLEAELISALCVLRKARRKNKLLKEEVTKLKEKVQNPNEINQTITNLMIQLEEARRIEEALVEQLEENLKVKENLEAEIVSLRKDLQKRDLNKKFEMSSKMLDQILSSQKSFHEKSGLGYKQQEDNESSSSMKARKETKPSNYANIIQETLKDEEGMHQQKPLVDKEVRREGQDFRKNCFFTRTFHSQV